MKPITINYNLTKTTFVAVDGTEFGNEQACLDYEKSLSHKEKMSHIMRLDAGEFPKVEYFYFPANRDEVETLIEDMKIRGRDSVYLNGKDVDSNELINVLSPGTWIGWYTEDGGDHWDTVWIYDNYFFDFMKELIKKMDRTSVL